MSSLQHKVVIVGGGAAGITVAAILRRKDASLDIAIIEPSEIHYYQPAFTVIGGGAFEFENSWRKEEALIPKNVKWIKDRVTSFQPAENTVTLSSGTTLGYEYLVVCPGIQLDWEKITGLTETLGKNGVCSNYSPEVVKYTWECIKNFKGGKALFTQPPMPIKCAGAPQKIMYLAADRFRQRGILEKSDIQFCTTLGAMFGIPFFAQELDKVAKSYGAKRNYNSNLVAVDGPTKTATFERTLADRSKETFTESFEMIHVTPPQSAPNFIKQSPLANAAGWIEVNDNTLQHTRFANIFGLGDAASTGNAKTAAAVRKQAPTVVDNILALMQGKPLSPRYDGYGSCPLTTSLHSVILAEFAYAGKVTPSFPLLDPRKGRYIWWWAKVTGLPLLYWQYMLKGYTWDIPHKASYAEKFVAESAK